jgi:hypothetical protein
MNANKASLMKRHQDSFGDGQKGSNQVSGVLEAFLYYSKGREACDW